MNILTAVPTEVCALVGVIDPDAYTAAAYTTGYIPLKDFQKFMAVVYAGDLGSSATIDAKLTVYTDGSGSGAYDVPGAAITQLTQAGTDSNKQAIINFDKSFVAGSTAYTHLRLTVTVGTATSDMGAAVYGFAPVYGKASANDLSSVDEIVTVAVG